MRKQAIISDCGKCRYRLAREWGEGWRVVWLMLNPSTADASLDDPTIRRCIGFAKRWGFAGIDVFNLFALRATNPQELYTASDPIGPANDTYLAKIQERLVIAAYGNHGVLYQRGQTVLDMLLAAGNKVGVLGLSKTGQPNHPLYKPADTPILYPYFKKNEV